MGEKKIIIGFILITALILIGGLFFVGNSPAKTTVEKTVGAKIETPENNFDFKNIPYSGGFAIHVYPVKNTGTKDLRIANLATSCMCTKVYFKSKDVESPKYGMKSHASGSADWSGTLKSGESGQIIAVFDPTAHGPQGVGPISRQVSFETNDPDHPYVEFSFEGTVVK
ncbi:DUF1573 domain-containing protein [Patescibacteria group bacterium]|nr:DUF1573 domain-containing protein [Patescibacteria group bacterium]